MTLDKVWEQYEAYTKAASDIARQLSFAGIAVIWLFKVEAHGTIHLDDTLLLAGASFVCTLASDLLQALAGTFVYWVLGKYRERKPDGQQDGDYPEYILWPIDFFFLAKFALVILGYVELLRSFLVRLN